jgi:anti-sigma regulatory factor (Ser/Thr protein kinase)
VTAVTTRLEVVQYQLNVDQPAVQRVRALIVAVLAGWALTALADDVALCVSELVSNIVQHVTPLYQTARYPGTGHRSYAGPLADVLISRERGSRLVLEVRDQDPRLPEKRPLFELAMLDGQDETASPDPDAWLVTQLAESGRGLAVVEASCDQLTWCRLPGAGKAVRCCWWLTRTQTFPAKSLPSHELRR